MIYICSVYRCTDRINSCFYYFVKKNFFSERCFPYITKYLYSWLNSTLQNMILIKCIHPLIVILAPNSAFRFLKNSFQIDIITFRSFSLSTWNSLAFRSCKKTLLPSVLLPNYVFKKNTHSLRLILAMFVVVLCVQLCNVWDRSGVQSRQVPVETGAHAH